MSVPFWFTATAAVALFAFVAKVAIDGWVALLRQRHLISALRAYLECAREQQEGLDFKEMREKVGDGEGGYTPYILYDPTIGFSIQDIRREYSFLKGNHMKTIIRYITADAYVLSMYDCLRTEYMREFSRERKLSVLAELEEAKKRYDRCLEDASKTVEGIAEQFSKSTYQQLKYVLRRRSS